MEYIRVELKDLPCTVRGFTVYCYDEGQAYFTIIINSRMSADMQCKAYDHEISHIDNGDFECMHEVNALEYSRHLA